MTDSHTAKIAIRPIRTEDRAEWEPLWAGYLRFYRHRLPASMTDETFRRLCSSEEPLHGIVAATGAGRLTGFAHFLFHPSTWSRTDLLYLEDLFVDPEVRGGGIGRSLIEAVYARAEETGAGGVYWMTQEYNAEGRALYDTLARRTSFIRYER